MIRDDVDVSSVDGLLGILEGTSGRTARLIDIPPVELAELRTSLRELRDEATDLPSQEQLQRLYDGLRRTAAAEERSLLEVSQGIGMAFVTSARTLSDRHLKVPYREDWRPLRDEGFAAYARRVSRPYGEAAASHFHPERRTYTERVLNRIQTGDEPESFEFCDELDAGFGWIAQEKLGRTSHALESRGEVWVFDPILWEPALERIRELGEPAGVVQLLDRHARDSAEVAAALGVPHYAVPVQGITASPLEIVPAGALAILDGGRRVDPGAARPRRRRRPRHRRLLPCPGRAPGCPPAPPPQAAEGARAVRAAAHPLRPREGDPRRGCARGVTRGAGNRPPPSAQGLARRSPPGLVTPVPEHVEGAAELAFFADAAL